MIEQAEIDLVKRETDLVKLVESSGVKLKRKGKQLAGLCPFHDDHEPSLIVDPKKQLWNCLGACSEGGDVYRWVMKRDRLDFKAAHRLLAALVLLAPGEAAKEDDELKTEGGAPAQNDLLWLSRVVEHYHQRLLETPAAHDYLRSRGITAPEFVTTFWIGYADGTLLQVISPEGRAALKRVGVITEGGRELMGGCVVFPLVGAASGLQSSRREKRRRSDRHRERDRRRSGVERRPAQRHSGLRRERADRRDRRAFARMPSEASGADARQ